MPNYSLFRPEALEAQRQPALGNIQINTPPGFWTVSLLAVAFLAVGACYVYFGYYTRRATVDGMLVPVAGLVTLSATGAGLVQQVDVREGEEVARGDVLVKFDNPVDSTAFGNTGALITADLDSERDGLRQDLRTQKSLAASQAVSVRALIASLRAQLAEIGGQLALQRAEAEGMSALLKRITPLSREGYVSVYELQQQENATFNAELQLKELRTKRLTILQQLSQATQQLRQIPLTLAAQQNDTRNKLAQVEQALAQNEAQRAWVLRAPRAGVVSSLLIKPGQAVTAGEPLLTVLPAGSGLQAQLLVPSSSIGFVQAGERVVLRYQAFPYQKFGLYFGVVGQVSRSALSPLEVTELMGGQSSEPLYRVLVRLDRQWVLAYGRMIALRPGMALQAEVLLDRRRLIEWVLEPFYSFRRRAVSAPARSANALRNAKSHAASNTTVSVVARL